MIHERDRHTDAQTPHDGIGCACTATHGKKQTINRNECNY